MREAAVRLLLDLESRGCSFRLDGADIIITPSSVLNDADRVALRTLKPHVRHLIAYQAPGVQ